MEAVAANIIAIFGMPLPALVFVCLLVFAAGYVDAVAGGGGLIALPAYLIAGLPTHTAIATSKMSSSMGTIYATWEYARAGFINLKLALPCIACALVGSPIGANLVLAVDDSILKIVLLVILPCTALYVMRSKSLDGADREPFSHRRTVITCMAIAFTVGIYDGFYGPGTGTFLMLLLNGAAHLKLGESAGVTKAINLTTNLAALAVFFLHGQVLIALGLLAGACNVAGSRIGARSFVKKGAGIAKPLTLIVVGIFFFKVIYDLVTTGL